MATFEELIRQDLMALVHRFFPTIVLDATGEPNTARVLTAGREFDRSTPRLYKAQVPASNPPQADLYRVTADVSVTAALELHSARQLDAGALIEELLRGSLPAQGPAWTWRGRSVRVIRTLVRTRLADIKTCFKETFEVSYQAPFFSVRRAPQIADETWFDGWEPAVVAEIAHA